MKDVSKNSRESKSQTEVWEWKEKASEELNKLSSAERIASLKKFEEDFLKYFAESAQRKSSDPVNF